ncbi:ATP-binding cassette domain-containing protein [Xanthobacter sp. 91]|uniref:branched-chain amino acid ABC transporter ATP-binding protein/permease n=1 Tax=Xanthobacter sp. 91 TaxID=1117244 RepID=UPI000496A631|nr:ATP-binding cassette domain-containing protein [Xanthobacter sp. 91]
MKPLLRALTSPVAIAGVTLVALTGLAVLTGAAINHVTQIAIYALYAVGVNVLIGYLGLVPFGASLFFGCASYAVALTLGRILGNEILALAWAILFSLLLSAVLGAIILRRKGLYFSLITLACSQVAFEIAFKWTEMTGGENGIQNVPRPLFPDAVAFHWFTLVVVVLGLAVLWQLAHTPFGRLMQAVRDNEQRTTMLGYNTFVIRWIGFCISGMAVGAAGGLLAMMLQGAYADNMSWQRAGDPVLMAALGGVHHFLGPIWGAITFLILENELSVITENWWLIFAPIIIVFALLSPEGMAGIVQRLRRREGWALTRKGIPPRPAVIRPYVSALAGRGAASSEPVLSVRGLSKKFGSIVTQADISLDVHANQLHSIIGPNGAGKTTFFNILTGLIRPDDGRILFEGADITTLKPHQRAQRGIARSFQILSVFPHLTVFENVRIAVARSRGFWHGWWRDAYRDDETNMKVWSALAAVGLADRAADLSSELSHGENRLLEIAITLAGNASVLLLDEPLAGLAETDRKVVSDLIVRLSKSHTVMLIEHDIDRVLSLSDRITVLHQGRLIADGKPQVVARNPEVISAYMGKAKGDAGTERESVRPQARAEAPAAAKPVLLSFKDVCAGYGGGTVLEGLDLEVRESEVVALLGRNGVGKTTALRTMMGAIHAHEGRVTFAGEDITALRADRINRMGISIVPEGRRLFPNLTVQENLALAARAGGAGLDEVCDLFPKLRILMRNKAENLSGGERQMVAIARALMVPSRLILLDEPYEGLAPAVVQEVKEAVLKLTTRASLVIVEHHAEEVLAMADRAYVLVNGQVAFAGAAQTLAHDIALQDRLLGIAAA